VKSQLGPGTLFEIHDEHSGDEAAIRELNRRTFGGDNESRIVDALRANDAVLLSLVATLNGAIVGHILYSPVSLRGEVAGAGISGLARYRQELSSVP
jgi:putative acetyltransferase